MIPPTEIRYDELVEDALKGVLRTVLQTVIDDGLPGQHHFFITFRTRHPEVSISDVLMQRYPEEMTIVLQYQFWDLTLDDAGFGVTLSFDDKPERLEVPFDAVTGFLDPSVKFGLQFRAVGMPETPAEGETDGEDNAAEGGLDADGGADDSTGGKALGLAAPTALPVAKAKSGAKRPSKKSKKAAADDAKADDAKADEAKADGAKAADDAGDVGDVGGDNVVTLDAFRKK